MRMPALACRAVGALRVSQLRLSAVVAPRSRLRRLATMSSSEEAWRQLPSPERLAGGPLEIVKAGDPVLRQAALPVPEDMFGRPQLAALAEAMIRTMRAAPGVGLAAPQVGVSLQVMVLEDREEYVAAAPPELVAAQGRSAFAPLILINPRLAADGNGGARFFEGCLSVPGWQALVERYDAVTVAARDVSGAPVSLRAAGWQARILQHEADHLAGVLYVDRMLSRSFGGRAPGGGAPRLPADVPPPGRCACCHAIAQPP